MGSNHYYFNEYQNQYLVKRIADKCYLPMNKLMLSLIEEFGSRFKVSYSISGMALDQFEYYAPEVIESFKKLAKTGCVEFIAETYAHSLASLTSKAEFEKQVEKHRQKIKTLFGQTPETFRNTELIYSDSIGEMVANMGFKTMLAEGAKHILGWKSPNFLYCNSINPKLKILTRNYELSDDISFRFATQSMSADKFTSWLNEIPAQQECVNLFMDYETFGEHQWAETGIFDFMKSLPGAILSKTNFTFNTPSEVSASLQPMAPIHVPSPISWADEERDTTAWLGNELQDDAFKHLYSLEKEVYKVNNPALLRDWELLQSSDHFYYMCTKWFSDGDVHKYFNAYNSPYEAYINYMNVLSDFILRLEEAAKTESNNQPIAVEEKPKKAVKSPKKKIVKTEVKRVKSKSKK
jgi:alpha-amylase